MSTAGDGPRRSSASFQPPGRSSSGFFSEASVGQTSSAPLRRGSWTSGISHISRISRVSRVSLPEPPSFNDSAFARLAQSPSFQNTTLFFILANAAWIGVDTEWNNRSLQRNNQLPLAPACFIVDIVFCLFFAFELVVRLLAYRQKASFVRDNWFVFDGVLLIFMLAETSTALAELGSGTPSATESLGVFRLLRLMRLTRLMRLMRFFPELMTLVRGMVRAMESVLFVVLFMLIILYSAAIVFTSQVGRPPSERPPGAAEGEDPTALDMFGDMGSSMMTLLTHGVLGDNLYETLVIVKDESLLLLWLFIAFMIISGITLLNMLIGVLCKVVQDTARLDSEKRRATRLRETFCRAFKAVDSSNDGYIQEQEWSGIQTNPEVRQALLRLGVDESEMDLRLSQLRAKVFWDRRPSRRTVTSVEKLDSGFSSERGSRQPGRGPGAQSQRTPSKMGPLHEQTCVRLDFEEFVEQVSDLQWDKKASSLDVALFQSVFESETKTTKKLLDDVEKLMMELFIRRGFPLPPNFETLAAGPRPAARAGADTSPPPEMHLPPEVPLPLMKPVAPKPPEALPPELHAPPELPAPPPSSPLKALVAKALPPLQAPPRLPPLSRAKVSPSPAALRKAPLHPDRPAAWGNCPISKVAGEAHALSFPSRQKCEGQKEHCSPASDRLASVPTEVLMDIMRSRLQRPRKKSLS